MSERLVDVIVLLLAGFAGGGLLITAVVVIERAYMGNYILGGK
jgi:hypothetical protein